MNFKQKEVKKKNYFAQSQLLFGPLSTNYIYLDLTQDLCLTTTSKPSPLGNPEKNTLKVDPC